MKSIKKYKAIGLALMIILISMTGPIMAQTSTPDNSATSTRADHDGDRDYSWIGLIGLAGLLGLAGKKRVEASTPRTATR